ncbi:hypothetical protein LSTR_LSTR014799 [Laodelphax striatellus]|uniref:Cadherin domain-containing protein n=1 Tax=Laodelphax striatellus TaxID=195883 RepID=A0A482WRJ2_LAOST|nr:hypothetical protein LSTR_LSTR014799 [Laodelphax striatellus]
MVKVREDVSIGFVVGNVVTLDGGGSGGGAGGGDRKTGAAGGHVMYTLTSLSPAESAFDMDRSSGALVVARQLDRETRPEHRLEVRALDTSTSSNPQSSAVLVRVDITDVNDNAPRWERDPVVIAVPEDAAVGAAVGNFSATDADAGPNGELRYFLDSVEPENGRSKFAVDRLTGSLTLLEGVDFESVARYTLVVSVKDQAVNESERLTTSLTAVVEVQDTNDNAPEFLAPSDHSIHLGENLEAGATVVRIVAVDRDSEEYGRVTYALTSGNEEGRFTLNHDTGLLTIARPEPLQQQRIYALNVTASDHGNPARQSHCTLQLVFRGSTSTPPRFTQSHYHVNVSEDTVPGTFLLKLTARAHGSDTGTGSNLSYQIPSGIAYDRFTVDPERGAVSLAGTLDRETKDHYLVPVYAVDRTTGQFDSATVSIRVTDVNDHAPEFRPGACYPLVVPENSDLAVVHRITAVDRDAGPNGEVTYSIVAGNAGNKFSVDLHSGELSARPLDRESQQRLVVVFNGLL